MPNSHERSLVLLFVVCLALRAGAEAGGTPLPHADPQAAGVSGGNPAGPSVDAASGATGGASGESAGDAVSAASAEAQSGASPSGAPFLGFPSRAQFHRVSGWTSTGLLLAAGVVGGIRSYQLINGGHSYRDSLGIDDEGAIGQACSEKISGLWMSPGGQTLRWVHVGLLAAGETLYVADAATGIASIREDEPLVSRRRLHRYAFFAHAALMVSEAVIGIIGTEALRRGDHEFVEELGVAHVAIGFAIPALMAGSGLVMDLGR